MIDKYRTRLDKLSNNRQRRSDIGLVIGTYSSPAYISLHLEQRKRLYPSIQTLVHDDCSGDKRLNNLCKVYNCDFSTTPNRNGHPSGDLFVFSYGLRWASERNIEYLVKISRRFIPLVNWVPGLINLINETKHSTYSNICKRNGWGFRTDCMVMKVKAWLPFVEEIEATAIKHRRIFVESYMHETAKIIYGRDPAFIEWGFIGNNRNEKSSERLWHTANTIDEYMELAVYNKLNISKEEMISNL